MKRLYLMITITNRVVGSGRFVDFYRAFGAPVVFTALGRGTASDEVLSYLGLEATEKAVLFSVVTPACKDTLVKERFPPCTFPLPEAASPCACP